MKVIINGKIILENSILQDAVLLYENEIMDIIKKEDFTNLKEAEEIIDAKDNYVSPGFIDVHIHGFAGADTMDATEEALAIMSKEITKTGVTSFLPTTMTMSEEDIVKAFNNIRNSMKINLNGARIQGAHMEGPFINKKFKGAQSEKYIKKPSYEFIEPFLDIIKLLTLAPEEDTDLKFIKKMQNIKNTRLSIGHTAASFEEALKAMDNGVTYITHTFNGMTGFHHRNPGVIGAVFSRDVDCEIIADTIHVHKGFFQAFIDINKKERVILITDSMRAGGLESGRYELGGQQVIVDEKSARLEDGTLAGSILKLNIAIKNIRDNTNYKLNEIVNMASINPARAIGIDDKFGSISKGKKADITIFDEDINILKTIIDGKVVYEVINYRDNLCR